MRPLRAGLAEDDAPCALTWQKMTPLRADLAEDDGELLPGQRCGVSFCRVSFGRREFLPGQLWTA
jgi:hypothetical protein